MGTTQLDIPKLALILIIYQNCNRKEGNNKRFRVYTQNFVLSHLGFFVLYNIDNFRVQYMHSSLLKKFQAGKF